MLSTDQVNQYLQRIHFKDQLSHELSCLNALHKAHIHHIPFENLDIPFGNKISLDIDSLFDKIIHHKRGGFCYELNFLFSQLLTTLGFSVSLLAAQVFNDNQYGKKLAHLLLQVDLNAETYIADIGFGDSFREPLKLNAKAVTHLDASYQTTQQKNDHILLQNKNNTQWQTRYKFSLQTYQINDFLDMCHYQQTSVDSTFTQRTVCTLATDVGRKTISNGRLIVTENSQQTETIIASEADYRHILQQHFKITLAENISLKRLLPEHYQ